MIDLSPTRDPADLINDLYAAGAQNGPI